MASNGGDSPRPTTSLGEVLATYGSVSDTGCRTDPFLTVLTRTQGRRPHLLAEVFTGLSEQTDRDFEVVVVRHRTTPDEAARVDDLVAEQPQWMSIRVLDVTDPGRSAPLNAGFEAARGCYVAIHDDDDLALPAWVATFKELATQHAGQVVRAVAVRQHVVALEVGGQVHAEQQGDLDRPWPATFSFVDHLIVNSTPPISVAFPRAVFASMGERFDEALDTTEDWDFLMRAAGLLGVACSPAETSLYRWWVEGESSRTEHSESEWAANHAVVQARLDDRIWLLPRGSVSRFLELIEAPTARIRELEAQLAESQTALAEEMTAHFQALETLNAERETLAKKQATIERLRRKLKES